jgi:RNA-directed DNA polymerase
MGLSSPASVQKLWTTLHAKAKDCPNQRFHALYDKLYRPDVLAHAYARCKSNDGSAGVDGREFQDIEKYGRERWLGELALELRNKTYKPRAVLRVWIPKADGKRRPLGIPTIKDRVAQMAAVLVLGPIFEADLQPEQYAYREQRSALDAVRAVHGLLSRGHTEVVDADLSGYFDSIPHAQLMECLARRIVDGSMLHIVKLWLEAPVEETDRRGGTRVTTENSDSGLGTPQGAPISPLLSNVYMRRFVLGWKTLGFQERLGARIVNYADDFVICCRGTAQEAMEAMRTMMGLMKLTVNETKTRLRKVPEETFDFLGYTYGTCYSWKGGRPYIGTKPSKKRIARICESIHEATGRDKTSQTQEEVVTGLNRMMVGWSNYFCLGPVTDAYRNVEDHARKRLRQWLRAKHKTATNRAKTYHDGYLHDTMGLVRLTGRTRSFPWATA